MKAQVRWAGERTFVGESGSGNAVVVGTTERDGPRIAASPMELLLIGTGACTAYDVVHILEKGRDPIEGCEVVLEAERADAVPSPFTRIHMRFRVTGRGLDRARVERAIRLSAEKYCSASAMLAKTAEITHEFEVIDPLASGP